MQSEYYQGEHLPRMNMLVFLIFSQDTLMHHGLQFASAKKAGTTNSYKGCLGAICSETGDKILEGTLGNSLTYKRS